MKTKKTMIVVLTVVLALIGAFSVFAWDYHMHDDGWGHMHSGMWSQTDDHMSDHAANCWTGSGQKWHHQVDDEGQQQ